MKEVLVCGLDFGGRDTVSIGVFSVFNGLRLIETSAMVEHYEDWSAVRSPGRARRRRAKGHRQNIVIRSRPQSGAIQHGDALYAHPATADALAKAIAAQQRDKLDEAVAQAVGFAKSEQRSDDYLLTLDKIRAAQARLSFLPAPPPSWDFAAFQRKMNDDIARAFGFPKAPR